MSVVEAAADIGIPVKAVRKYIEKNPHFKQRVHRMREWSSANKTITMTCDRQT